MSLNVEITLFEENGRGPAMWFLGVPPHPRVALNFNSPGPITLDFDTLSEEEKRHIIVSLNMRKIRTSVSYADLLRNYAPAPEVAPVVEEFIKQDDIKQKSRTIVEEVAAARAALQRQCASLFVLGVKSLKTEIAKIEDVQMIKMLRQLELQKPERKRRRSVLEMLEAKIKANQEKIVLEIEKSAASGSLVDPGRPYDKLEVGYSQQIEETDHELVQFAMGDPLKIKDSK